MPDFPLLTLGVIAAVTLVSAAVAFSLKNILHCLLLLVVSWVGVAAFYLWAGAEFIAFAQVLVYVGAISMVVLFAVLLTRQHQPEENSPTRAFRAWGALAAALVATALCAAVVATPLEGNSSADAGLSVRQIGELLMGPHVAALLIIGVLLTVALLGAVLLAAPDAPKENFPPKTKP